LLSVSRERELPLSFSQSRIWFMHQLAPKSSAYNIAAPIRFTGKLHKEALRQSLDEMVRRHESLRTTFSNAGEQPIQVIGSVQSLKMREVDLRALPADLRTVEAKRILSEEARRPFELEKGPLLRVLLAQLDDNDHVMLLTMHHAISDHWSLNAIAREVTLLYNTFCNQPTAPLESLPVQYADFVTWQNQRLNGDRLAAQLSYWEKQLDGMQATALPTDRPRPSVQTFHGAHQSLDLSTELLAGLKKVSREADATLYMVFLAAFKILLSRYCNQEDIGVGSPVADRTRLEWEGVIGTFVNIVVLRTDLSGNPTLRETLARVRKTVVDALGNQELPFERLIEHLHPERDPGRAPLVQILFNFYNTLLGKIDLAGLSWMPFEIEQGAAQFDLTVTIDPDTLRKIVVTYNTDLYDRATIGRMLDHYERILRAVIMDPDQPVATLPLLSDREHRQLVVDSNDTRADYPQICVHELFEAQVQRTPDAIAVACGRQQLTYGALDERANRVAHRLRALGVTPEVTVGICLDRSPDVVIGLLAILKAGGAYVPIDPAYPPDRIASILKHSGMPVVLTQAKLVKDLPKNGYRVLCMEDVAAEESTEKPEPLAGLRNLAYVIYTSGSTGEPKGVEVEHRSLMNFLHSVLRRPGITEKDVLLSVTTVSFDIAALELFLPLIAGARVVLVSREITADGRRLIQEIQTSKATVMQATPATWRLLLEAGWKGATPFKILCGGEALSADLAKSLLDRGSSVWNLYGPTETTVWSTVWEASGNSGRIPIGRPIHNTRAYVLDAHRQPVPEGVAGELYIGGHGVARGYHKGADLTAEKFIFDPFSPEPGARMFKTGDWVRYLPDGNLEWLGRIDQQIKIRGHRIEPREIEALLERHPAVKEALAIAREDRPGEKQLVAYVVREKHAAATVRDLRKLLESKLPAYMLPSEFVFLDAFPKTPNGKLNRRALPAPDREGLPLAECFEPPRDKIEHQLAQIWEKLLNVSQVGLRHNFFDLGGHSLMAARLMGQVERVFGKQIPLVAFIANPTLGHLAQLLRREGCSAHWSSLVPVQPAGSKRPFFWIHGDASNWTLAKHLDADQPLYLLLHQSQSGEAARHKSVERIAEHYLEEIQLVQSEGPYFLGGYSFGGLAAFEIAQQLCKNGQRVAFLALLEPTTPANGRLPASANKPLALSQTISGWRDRVLHYRDVLASMNRAQRLRYIARGITAKTGSKRAKITKSYKRLACKIFLTMHWPLPAHLRTTYLMDIYTQAARTYSAQSYPGSITIFRGEKWTRHFESFWKQLAGAGVNVHAVRGDHMDLTQEPFVEIWASQLRATLQRAQETVSEPSQLHGDASGS
ncbi:MAG: non-ribosomal peptide synthetase, partial [Candidatus Binatia bacterium]